MLCTYLCIWVCVGGTSCMHAGARSTREIRVCKAVAWASGMTSGSSSIKCSSRNCSISNCSGGNCTRNINNIRASICCVGCRCGSLERAVNELLIRKAVQNLKVLFQSHINRYVLRSGFLFKCTTDIYILHTQ